MGVLDFHTQSPVEEAGGKGHNLQRLTRLGFNVPGGCIVGASLYRRLYPAPPEFEYKNAEILDRQCVQMRDSVLARDFPEDIADELRSRIAAFGPEARFAVRSSSTFEDLSTAAFAGQHDTFLNVRPEGVPDAIRRCFASLWSPHAVQYRRHNGFAQAEASMAVVVQRMITPDTSGVIFSVDPVGGKLQQVLIEANFGVGESVVGGEAVTDSWVVDVQAGAIIERRVNTKEHQVVAMSEGVIETEVPADRRELPCLADEDILAIASKAKQIERAYAAPQDIEWGLAGGELFILQARPQTRIPARFTRDESAERFPNPLTPLTWSYVDEAFNISLEHSLKLMGISLPTRPWFSRIDSYIYGNQNAVELLAMNRPLDMSSFEALRSQLPSLRERFQWVIDLPNEWAANLDSYLMSVGKLGSACFDEFSMADYQKYFQELFETACVYFKPNIAISMTQAFLIRTLYEYLVLLCGDVLKAQGILKGIVADCGAKTGQVNRELNALAATARTDASLLDLLSQGGTASLTGLGAFPEFHTRFMKFLERYGHRETTFDYYEPTWCEAPEVVLDLIQVLATSEQGDALGRDRELLTRRVASVNQVMQDTPEEFRPFVDELIRLARQFSWLDDMEHFQTTRINPLVRRVIGAFGRHLGLADPYDLFFLTRQEIEGLGASPLPEELARCIAERKREHLAAAAKEPAWNLGEDTAAAPDDGGAVRGVPGSPGNAEGEAYLVRGVEDFPGMPQGAILVAKTTNPSWTPLFYKCSALITESGGPLSHGAVTARELGIPAVMFIRSALTRFRNGQRLRVDGLRGIVTLA